MKIPYYKQTTVYTCAAACLRMCLAALGMRKSEMQAAKLLKTNFNRKGTPLGNFPEAAEKLQLTYQVGRNASMRDLEKALQNEWIVLVGFFDEEENNGHFGVLLSISKKQVIMHDPWDGPNIIDGPNATYPRPYFEKMWKLGCGFYNVPASRWYIAFRR